jgi:succinyl-CoA synthetase beta subunit
VRLDGTNAEEGRRIVDEAAHPRIVSVPTMDGAAAEVARLAGAAA